MIKPKEYWDSVGAQTNLNPPFPYAKITGANALFYEVKVQGDCGKLHSSFEEWQQCKICHKILLDRKKKEQPKMTRDEARTKLECVGTVGKEAADFLLNIQALGLIKFDEKTSAHKIKTICKSEELQQTYGTVKIELWPEGLVVWVGGEIRWKSWEEREDKVEPEVKNASNTSPSLIIRDHIQFNFDRPMYEADKIVNELLNAGYLIVRKENV